MRISFKQGIACFCTRRMMYAMPVHMRSVHCDTLLTRDAKFVQIICPIVWLAAVGSPSLQLREEYGNTMFEQHIYSGSPTPHSLFRSWSTWPQQLRLHENAECGPQESSFQLHRTCNYPMAICHIKSSSNMKKIGKSLVEMESRWRV